MSGEKVAGCAPDEGDDQFTNARPCLGYGASSRYEHVNLPSAQYSPTFPERLVRIKSKSSSADRRLATAATGLPRQANRRARCCCQMTAPMPHRMPPPVKSPSQRADLFPLMEPRPKCGAPAPRSLDASS